MTPLVRYASFIALLGGCSSTEAPERPTRAQCETAREHEAELVVAVAAKPQDDARTKAELAKHRENLASVGGSATIDRCVATDSGERLACVTGARDVEALRKCPPAP
jgi:hypothetical protein